MSIFNRLVVIVLFSVVAVGGLVIAAVPELLLAFLQAWTRDAVVTPQDRLASAVLGLVLVVASVAVLYFELRSEPRKTVLVSKMVDGKAALELSSVAQRLRQQVEAIEGVRRATPQVTSHGRNVDVRLVVMTATDVDVPAKATEIAEVVRECIGKMGVGLGKQQINLRHEGGPATTPQRT